ncbi:MAG: DNA replication/repair protein RecF [Clostridiales bacterium]|nr:DNA replication/repair protein RecF [Clostridiales bacterium]
MFIKEIELKNFRNYEEIKLSFHEKINIFIGNNAQGKTNILEGIYISSFGRSFRSGKDNQMIKFGEKFCKAKVTAIRDEEDISVEIVIGEKEKGVKINGAKIQKTAELLENVLVVIFSPEDLKIIKEGPEKRRSFMDRELSQISPSYYVDFSSYRRALMQRNALLKERNAAQSDFDVWNMGLVEHGTKIIRKRRNFIEKLNRISREIHNSITKEKEFLEVIYDSFVADEEDIKAIFLSKLEQNQKKDIFKGNTETGPHRDDLEIRVNGIDIRKYGSQGQQRTAALSLKLAELELIKEETGEEAILLLDDVLSELDSERQSYLINALKDTQLFITATEISEHVKEKLPKGYLFKIRNGKLE